MPKSKEQKQQEALARQAINFYRVDLAQLIRVLPGGSQFSVKSFGDYDMLSLLNDFDKVEKEAKKFGIKLPRLGESFMIGYNTPGTRLLGVLSTVWVGQLLDLYEYGYAKYKLDESYHVDTLFNAAGKAREKSDFAPIMDEMRFAMGRLKKNVYPKSFRQHKPNFRKVAQ